MVLTSNSLLKIGLKLLFLPSWDVFLDRVRRTVLMRYSLADYLASFIVFVTTHGAGSG